MILPFMLLVALMSQDDEFPRPPTASITVREPAAIVSIPGFSVTMSGCDEKDDEKVEKVEKKARIRARIDREELGPQVDVDTYRVMPEMMTRLHRQLEKIGTTKQWMSDPSVAPAFAQAFQFDIGGQEPRINIDISELPIRDAIVKVFKSTRFDYGFTDDLPKDVKVTLKVPNVRLSTALNMITEAGGVNWTKELRIAADASVPKMFYRIQKAPVSSQMVFVGPRGLEGNSVIKIGPGRNLIDFDTKTLGMSFIMPETRSKFKCPSCDGTVVAYRPRTVTHCETCHRAYRESEKTCPRDGTRRPTPAKPWKFCPLCGKSVKVED
jgi:hypothetical protein